MNLSQLVTIRSLIAEGASDDEILSCLDDAEIDAQAGADFERDAYGIDHDDGMTTGQREFHDRLSLGRNDAGEWLGFM